MERKTRIPDHSESYKRKTTVVEKRALRAHRRSIEWKHQRTETVNKRRNLGGLTPLKEVDSSLEEKKIAPLQKKKAKVDAATSRSQMLQKWKEEKALKKKLDSQQKAKKMPFKITHAKPTPTPFVFSVQPKNMVKPAPARRCTRSMALEKPEIPASRNTIGPTKVEPAHKIKKSTKPSHQPTKASLKDAADKRLTQTKPAASTKTTQPLARMTRSTATKVITAKQTVAKPPVEKVKKTSKKPDVPRIITKNVNYKRGEVSFAPTNFKFTVPTEVQSMVFTPLSPSSTASFLFPDQTHTATYDDKRCSTPKVGPKLQRLASNLSTSTIQVAVSSENSSDEEIKKNRSRSSRRKSTRTVLPPTTQNVVTESKTGTETSSDEDKKQQRTHKGRRKSTRKATTEKTMDITENETVKDNIGDSDEKTMNTSIRRTRGKSAASGDSSAESDTKGISSRVGVGNRSRTRRYTADTSSGDNTDGEKKLRSVSRTRSRSKSTSADSGSDKDEVKTTSDKLSPCEEVDRGTSQSDSASEAACNDVAEKPVASTSDRVTRTRGRSLAMNSDSSDGEKTLGVRNTPAARRRTRASYAPSSDAAAATDEDDEKNESKTTVMQVVASTSIIDSQKEIDEERKTERDDSSTANNFSATDVDSVVKENVMNGHECSQDIVSAAETSTHRTPSNSRRKSVLKSVELSSSAKPDEAKVETPKRSDGSGLLEGFCTPAPRDKATEDEEQTRLMQSTRSETAVFRTPASIIRTRRKVRGKSLSEPQKRFRTPRQHRNSLILRTMSPEEGVEFLRHSPMVEMSRRTPKSQTSPVAPLNFDPLPTFDDLDDVLSPRQKTAKPADSTSTQENTDNATVGVDSDVPESSAMPVVLESAKEGCSEGPQSPIFAAPDSTVPDTALDNGHNMTEANDNPVAGTVGVEAPEHDVPYFRNLLKTETDRLNNLSDKWNQIQDEATDIPDEVNGQIRTTVGQAQLLMRQRFKQFTGLVDDCEFHTGEKITTCTDLQGFWDMIFFQVEDVDSKFTELDKLKNSNWVIEKPNLTQKKKIVKKKIVKPASKTSVSAKSKFSQFRAKMKQQQEQKDETKTFEAGFFRVHSPVNSPEPKAKTGTPSTVLEKRLSSKHNSNTNSPMLKSVLQKEARKSVATQLLIASEQLSSSSSSAESEPEAPRSNKRKMSLSSSVGSHKKVKKQVDVVSPMLVDISSSTSNSDELTPSHERSRRSSVKMSARLQNKAVSFCETESASATKTSTDGGDFLKYLVPVNTNTQESMNTNTEVGATEDAQMDAPMKRDLLSEFDQESPGSTSIFTPFKESPVGVRPLQDGSREIAKRTPRRSSRRLEQKENVLFSPLVSLNTTDVDSPSTSFAKLRVDQTPGLDGSMKTVSVFTPDVNMDSVESRPEAGSASTNLMSFSPFTAPTVQSRIFDSEQSSPTPSRTRRSKRISLL